MTAGSAAAAERRVTQDDYASEKDSPAVTMRVDVAVLKEKVGSIDKKLDTLAASLANVYATKDEMKVLKEDIAGLKSNQGWIIKLIVGAVIVAVLGLVIVKGGIPRP